MDEEELIARCPPSSVVPRLHCILYRKLSNPELIFSAQEIPRALFSVKSDITMLRQQLVNYISSALGDDAITAEYLLLSMMSRVYRRDYCALGKLVLNITGCPEEPSQTASFRTIISSLLSSLVPKSHMISLTIPSLCEDSFYPHKDYVTNRLCSGFLQLSDATQLVIDETTLQNGKLDSQGTKNLKALNDLIVWQAIEYDFQYHPLKFNVDIPVVLISTTKSLLRSDCVVKLQFTRPFTLPFVPSPLIASEFLNKCRLYIAAFRMNDYFVDEQVSKIVQETFVSMRKADPNVTQEDFHLWLTLARLVSISFGEPQLTPDKWKYVLALEQSRRSRLQ